MLRKQGFTLIEILIVVSIIAILMLTLSFSITRQRDKADNARIKSDLSRLKIAFEDYYNDHNCYPPADWFDDSSDCGTPHLTPYLNQIPCDPHTGRPYPLEKDGACGTWFKLYGKLTNPTADPQAVAQFSESGSTLGNYGVSSSNTVVSVVFATPTPTPTPAPSGTTQNTYSYCYNAANKDCNSFDPTVQNCTPYFINDDYCGGCLANGSCTPL
ncbi:MAG: hypothetical protein UX62_C0005G0007 [Microgenomates group bacterium GW2011_GWA2_46_7]|nr:MAG: hypothetical protein UX62_C0005G0007 [Microgenomates group bacterium GW2011_GWA2_46_7]